MKEEIIELMRQDEWISEEETQMWIDLFPMMEKEHFKKLRETLWKK